MMGEGSTTRRTTLTLHEQRTRERMVTAALFLLIVGLGLFILSTLLRYGLLHVALLLFFGLLLAVLLRGLTRWVSATTGLADRWALAAVLVVLLALVVLFFWLVAPRIGEQVGDLTRKLPEAVRQLRELVQQKYPWARPFVENASVAEMTDVPTLVGRLTGFASKTFGVVVNIVVVVFIGVYLAAAPRENLEGAVFLFPQTKRKRAREVFIETGETLRLWMVGQLVPMGAIAAMTTAGLWLLRVELAVTIGIIAGLFNFIPNFGPLFALVPAALVALGSGGPEKVLWVVLLFMFAQSLEGYVITPLVQKRMVQLPPALTIAMQVVMGLLVGGIGVALAAPMTAALLVVVKMLYVEDVLKEETELPSEQAERRKEEREEEKREREGEKRLEDGG